MLLHFILTSVMATAAAVPYQASVVTERGLEIVTYETPHGNITCYLPDDLSAGDTIGGTVVALPKGVTEEERQTNADHLEGYVIEAHGLNSKVGEGAFKWEVPAGIAATTIFMLADGQGNAVSRTSIPVQPQGAPRPPDIQITPVGQAGRPVPCAGPFDGDLSNTVVNFAGNPQRPLAESPRKIVMQAPATAGPCDLTVSENGKSASGQFNSLTVRLSAGATTLLEGQSTELSCVVDGFQGMGDEGFPVSFTLTNLTPQTAVIHEIPGDVCSHYIQKEDLANGTYVYSTTLVGVAPGSFGINASISWWPFGGGKKPGNPMLTKPPTPANSTYAKCAWLITVGPGKGATEVDHSAICIDGTVHSFEGNGMNVYPNVGAYLNKRKFEDGRQVWMSELRGANKPAMKKKAQEIIDAKKPYHLTTNNCALTAAALIKAGGLDILHEVKPLRLKNRNENTGAIQRGKEITTRQIE